MKNAQRPEKISFGSLLNKLIDGHYVIPDFQREFEWKPWDVNELMKSIFMDYYIGTPLLWKGKKENFNALSCEPVYGQDNSNDPQYIVLDGQQRLTAIHYACCMPDVIFPKRKSRAYYYIKIQKFLNEEYDEAFSYEWGYAWWEKIMANPDEQFDRHIFPLGLLGQGPWKIIEWLKEYENYWAVKLNDAKSNNEDTSELEKYVAGAIHLSGFMQELIQEYQISYIELDQDIGIEKVCDIFTQINSRGVKLDIFDLLNAMLKPKGLQLKHMWRDVKSRLSFGDISKMNVYVLQVMSILLQDYCAPRHLNFLLPGTSKTIKKPDGSNERIILIQTKDEFVSLWEEAVRAIEDAIGILQSPTDFGVVSESFIPYPTIIPAFSSIRHEAKKITSRSFSDVNRKIRKWYWASVFTNRYSSAVESNATKDFRDLKIWFEDDEEIPALINEFENSFKNIDFRNETKKGTVLYNAIFNLMIINGAKDWATLESTKPNELDDHHVVPVSWGLSAVGTQIHTVLNRAPLTDSTNRYVIHDKLPNKYLPEMFDKYGEDEVRKNLNCHLISNHAIDILLKEEFDENDYHDFVQERQRTVINAINDLIVKSRIELEPELRELDSRIEAIELGFRRLIVDKIGDDTDMLPPHLKQKAQERLKVTLKRDASKDPKDYQTLDALLEFFDLRECEAVIISKQLWGEFVSVFNDKNVLMQRFSQLAELRNRLRHSRTVDLIAKKEGEASILWFEGIMRNIIL